MNEDYSHTQPGKVILFVMGATILFLLALLIYQPNSVAVSVLAVLLIVGWMFSRMTIEVTDDELKWKLGPGWLKKSVPLNAIESCEAIRYPWWYGYGIRLTPDGWLYNVSGKEALRIRLNTGKKLLLGTDDAENLKVAIEKVTGRNLEA